jgi:hypothetical protein
MTAEQSPEAKELAARFERIKRLTEALDAAQADSSTKLGVLDRLRRELEAARVALNQIRNGG